MLKTLSNTLLIEIYWKSQNCVRLTLTDSLMNISHDVETFSKILTDNSVF